MFRKGVPRNQDAIYTAEMMTKTGEVEKADRLARGLERDALRELGTMFLNPDSYLSTMSAYSVAVAAGDEFDVEASLNPQDYGAIVYSQSVAGVMPGTAAFKLRRWAHTRIIYIIDKDTALAVSDTDWASTIIPGEVLRNLPHPNPLIVLPKPLFLAAEEGAAEKYEAFIVLGINQSNGQVLDTHDPAATGLTISFIGTVVDADTHTDLIANQTDPKTGQIRSSVQMAGLMMSTPFKDLTMTERRESVKQEIGDLPPALRTGFNSVDDAMSESSDLVGYALALLVYLTTSEFDSEKTKVTSKTKNSKKNGRKNVNSGDSEASTVVSVGYRMGAALRQAKTSNSEAQGTSGRTVAPHIRRAHLHTFYRGEGHSERFVKWLPPMGVNVDGALENTQVHFPN